MDNIFIVIMLKNKETGILEKELNTFSLSANSEYLLNICAFEADNKHMLDIKLTTNRDVLDWEFEAMYDYYDTEVYKKLNGECSENEDCFNPTWQITVEMPEEITETEILVSKILDVHKKELGEVELLIQDKQKDYEGEL